MHPAVSLLLAATVGWVGPDERFVAVMAAHVLEVSAVAVTPESQEPPVTVASIPFYFDDFAPIPVPPDPVLPTYDLRLPIFRAKP